MCAGGGAGRGAAADVGVWQAGTVGTTCARQRERARRAAGVGCGTHSRGRLCGAAVSGGVGARRLRGGHGVSDFAGRGRRAGDRDRHRSAGQRPRAGGHAARHGHIRGAHARLLQEPAVRFRVGDAGGRRVRRSLFRAGDAVRDDGDGGGECRLSRATARGVLCGSDVDVARAAVRFGGAAAHRTRSALRDVRARLVCGGERGGRGRQAQCRTGGGQLAAHLRYGTGAAAADVALSASLAALLRPALVCGDAAAADGLQRSARGRPGVAPPAGRQLGADPRRRQSVGSRSVLLGDGRHVGARWRDGSGAADGSRAQSRPADRRAATALRHAASEPVPGAPRRSAVRGAARPPGSRGGRRAGMGRDGVGRIGHAYRRVTVAGSSAPRAGDVAVAVAAGCGTVVGAPGRSRLGEAASGGDGGATTCALECAEHEPFCEYRSQPHPGSRLVVRGAGAGVGGRFGQRTRRRPVAHRRPLRLPHHRAVRSARRADGAAAQGAGADSVAPNVAVQVSLGAAAVV
eukprot:ctg_652.g425